MKRNIYIVVLLLMSVFVVLTGCGVQKANFSVQHLRTEYLKNPLGIDVLSPRFTWRMESKGRGVQQKAYRILVATSPKLLSIGKADVWDSKKIYSGKSINIEYGGKPLKSNQTYYWEVRLWNNKNTSIQSKLGMFHTGLLSLSDWHGAWICAGDTTISAPLLRKDFSLKKEIKQATAFVTGVGFYELYVNGEKVGDHVLDPGITNYRKRTLYACYDVTNQMQKGGNAVGLILGNGAWRMKKSKNRFAYRNRNWGPPRALLQLNIVFKDGTSTEIVTNKSWQSSNSPITYNNFYGGEDYDARLEKPGWSTAQFDASEWKAVREVAPPGGILKSQLMQPIKVVQTIKPVRRTHPSPDVYLFDLGQNISGWWRIRVHGKRGTVLRIRGAETLNDSLFPTPLKAGDKLSTKFNYHSKVFSDYTLKGGGTETYEPRFFYTGFRYIEVQTNQYDGLDSISVEGRVVQTALPRIGVFSSSDSLINKIHHATVWSIIGNTHSYPSDCPQREKGAYTGDGQVIAEASIHNFNMAAFYTNWLDDMQDIQEKNGNIPNTAPNLVGGHGGGIPWGSAYILLPWWMYQYYGDVRIMKEHYTSMKRYVDYLYQLARHDDVPEEKYVINDFGSYWFSLGEWCAPGQSDGPVHEVVSTAYWYKDVVTFAGMAKLIGKDEDAVYYQALADTIKHAFNKKFLNTETNLYGTKTPYQTYQILALAFGLVPDAHRSGVLRELIHDIKINHHNHLNTGILGTKYLFPVLMEAGYQDLAYKILMQKTYPGYGYWIENGATTLWEYWSGKKSQNHQMFGSVDEFLYEYLAGIRPPKLKGSLSAYKQIDIRPFIPNNLNEAEASVETIRGEILSKWKRQGNQLELTVSIPANSSGRVSVPTMNLKDVIIAENGKTIWKEGKFISGVEGINDGRKEDDYVTFQVVSGDYNFKIKGR